MDAPDDRAIKIVHVIREHFVKHVYFAGTARVLNVEIDVESGVGRQEYLEHVEVHLEVPIIVILCESLML